MSDDFISRSALLDEMVSYRNVWSCACGKYDVDNMVDIVQCAPAVDAVEVVRCKDCKAWGKSPWGHFPKGWCKIHGRHRDPEYYCASGVRKDAEGEG